jgi:hypothetical protein
MQKENPKKQMRKPQSHKKPGVEANMSLQPVFDDPEVR